MPCRNGKGSEESLQLFFNEVPTLQLLGVPYCVDSDIPFTVDSDVQLVCKYLRAYKTPSNKFKGIDKLYYEEIGPDSNIQEHLVKFSLEPDLSEQDCHDLMHEFMTMPIKSTKIIQHLFIQ